MPQWLFGMSLYAFASPELIICSHVEQGVSRLETIDLRTGKLTIIDSPFTDIQFLKAANGQAVFRAGSADRSRIDHEIRRRDRTV